MREKILITGSEGFVGRHLTTMLQKKYEIIKFDIKIDPFQDVRDYSYLFRFMKKNKPNVIIHLAANPDVGKSVENVDKDLEINTVGTINVLKAAKELKVRTVVFTSTAQVYGEPKYLPVDENHPLYPKSPYGISKLSAEMYCNFFYEKYKVPVVVFRFFNIYGPGQPPAIVVPALIQKFSRAKKKLKMLGTKKDSRDFVYVEDVCKAIYNALKYRPVGEVINIGSGEETTIFRLAKTILKLMNKDIELIYPPRRKTYREKITRLVADVKKAKKLIHWEAKTELEDGIKKILKKFGYNSI